MPQQWDINRLMMTLRFVGSLALVLGCDFIISHLGTDLPYGLQMKGTGYKPPRGPSDIRVIDNRLELIRPL
jgi:hypothetical protein